MLRGSNCFKSLFVPGVCCPDDPFAVLQPGGVETGEIGGVGGGNGDLAVGAVDGGNIEEVHLGTPRPQQQPPPPLNLPSIGERL